MLYYADVPCLGLVRKLLNILNGCMEKVYSEMISLLFVFCQHLAMQVYLALRLLNNFYTSLCIHNVDSLHKSILVQQLLWVEGLSDTDSWISCVSGWLIP
jgi:hypothetical protein